MIQLILGILIWYAAHLFKRIAPGPRAALSGRMGDASKALFAAILVFAVVLMVRGFRAADEIAVYEPPVWGVHLNNLLMIAAIVLFGIGSSKSRLRPRLRHPMLLGASTWAVAHLLVNGDRASVVLFGSLLVWAVAEILVINRSEPSYEPYQGGTLAGDIRLGVISLVLFAVIAWVHNWLGYWPFPG